jgi:spore coat polysaccharide biosynthesis predicted glycosyltransferase SpsG
MHDYGDVPEEAALVVSVAGENGAGRLTGLAYTALRPGFWGLPPRTVRDDVRRALVTTGGGQFDALGHEVAAALAEGLRDADVALVRGPHAQPRVAPGVETLDAPDSLLEPMLAADLAVTAGGQTMLEAAAVGTPCIALPLIENQARQVELLRDLGGVCTVDPPDADAVVATAVELAGDPAARRSLSARGQRAVDGYGALRIAFEIEALVGRAS